MSAQGSTTGLARIYLAVSGPALTDQAKVDEALADLPSVDDLSPEDQILHDQLIASSLRFSKFAHYQSVAPPTATETGAESGPLDSAIDTEDPSKPNHNWFELGGRVQPGRWALKLDAQNIDDTQCTHKTFIVTRLEDDSLGVFSFHEGTRPQAPKDAICLKSKAGSCKSTTKDPDFDQVDLDVLNAISMGIKLYSEGGQEGSLSYPPISGSLDTLAETLLLGIPGSKTPISGVCTRGTVSLSRPSIAPHSNLASMRINFAPSK
jgi:hypothetical protein